MKNRNSAYMPSDDDVIRSVKEGRIQDFDIIIERYKTMIVNFIYRMVLDYDEAMSLSQDVFFRIYKNVNKFKPQDNFKAFIFTIAKNMSLNYIKKRNRSVNFSSLPGKKDENFSSGAENDAHALMEKQERDRLLERGLKNLKEEQRLALIMKVYMRLSYSEICDITGWSVPKVETLISRARKNLRNFVNMQENGGKDV